VPQVHLPLLAVGASLEIFGGAGFIYFVKVGIHVIVQLLHDLQADLQRAEGGFDAFRITVLHGGSRSGRCRRSWSLRRGLGAHDAAVAQRSCGE